MLVWKFSRLGHILVVLREFRFAVKGRKIFLEFDLLYVMLQIIQIHQTDTELRFMPVCLKVTDLSTSSRLDSFLN